MKKLAQISQHWSKIHKVPKYFLKPSSSLACGDSTMSIVDDWGHFAVEDWIAVGSDDVGKWHRDSDRGAPYLLSTLQDWLVSTGRMLDGDWASISWVDISKLLHSHLSLCSSVRLFVVLRRAEQDLPLENFLVQFGFVPVLTCKVPAEFHQQPCPCWPRDGPQGCCCWNSIHVSWTKQRLNIARNRTLK